MARIVFDTSVLISYTNNEPSADEVDRWLNKVAEGEVGGLISAAAVAELMERWSRARSREEALKLLESFKETGLVVMEVTEEIAKLAGPLKAKFSQLSTADAMIVSTAYVNKAKLYTFDKGFCGIGGVDIIGI
jgi:predicted nucleic acid-binding protein